VFLVSVWIFFEAAAVEICYTLFQKNLKHPFSCLCLSLRFIILPPSFCPPWNSYHIESTGVGVAIRKAQHRHVASSSRPVRSRRQKSAVTKKTEFRLDNSRLLLRAAADLESRSMATERSLSKFKSGGV